MVKKRELKIYYASGPEETRTITEPPTLKEMQKIVGGFIEPVKLPPGNGHKKMVVNEEGRLQGLPVNQKASRIAGQRIVGDVLVY